MNSFINLTKEFASKTSLSKKVEIKFVDNKNRPRLYCDNPAIVARFVARVKQEAIKKWGPSTRVLLRGQNNNHPGMIPSIFRDPCSDIECDLLVQFEEKFIIEVQKILSSHLRFKRPFLAALLQHYGIRTTWIDVVDNLWVAIWFATKKIVPPNKGIREVISSEEKTGWIYLLSTGSDRNITKCLDLRETHQALSLRPHAQHSWSLHGSVGKENELNKYVIATVEFPITNDWILSGNLWGPNYLFPTSKLDDTLNRLIKNDINNKARIIEEEESRIPKGTLGNIFSVKSSA